MINSKEYWENRYKSGGHSGAGSYGRLAEFKADFINDFIIIHSIEEVVEFGCGDGNQLSLFECKHYTGYDVSETIILKCREKFLNDLSKHFYLFDDYQNETYDLSLSLDVIFHLVEDMVFEDYMQKLFNSSKKFVIIYSSNGEIRGNLAAHLKDREFTNWIKVNRKDFVSFGKINNPYKYHDSLDNPENTSMSDFYIYKKI